MKFSARRVLALLKKDLFWAKSNLKLLAVMTAPLFLTVVFSILDKESTFGFTMSFLIAFIGIFSTSYLVIEEKQKGTLLSLLTTPLQSYELLLGKFLFNLILCLFFALFAIFLNQRFDLLGNPLVFLNLILFAGTTCFVGYVLGIFFKKEQEMSILAPALMLFFCSGDIAYKASQTGTIFPFFADYHFLQLLREVPVSTERMLIHSLFNLLYFSIALAMASLYTRFYFSNSRERRWSPILLYSTVAFMGALVLSGTSISVDEREARLAGYSSQKFVTDHWAGRFEYQPQDFILKKMVEARNRVVYLLQDKEYEGVKYVIAVRQVTSDELSPQARRQQIKKDPERFLLAGETMQLKTRDFQRYTYIKKDELVVLVESFCGQQLLQISFEYKLKKIKPLAHKLRLLNQLLKQMSFTCSKG